MRLLYLTPAYPPGLGGGERYVRALATALTAQGHELVVVTSTAVREADFWQGSLEQRPIIEQNGPITVHRLPIRPFPGGRTGLLAWRKGMILVSALPGDQSRLLGQMARLIPPITGLDDYIIGLNNSFDLVHAFNLSWEYPLLVGVRYARCQNLPLVITPFAHFGVSDNDPVAKNSTMDHQLRVLVSATHLHTLTEVERQTLCRLGVSLARITVVGGGLDPIPDATEIESLWRQYDIQPPYALFIGRQNYEKGAIQAARSVLALSDLPLNLGLIGDMLPEFARFYNRLSSDERQRIRLLGRVPETAKHSLLKQATMLLLPSRIDSLGLVVLEAWAHGLPVIGARAGGLAELIKDKHDGLLVPFDDVPALTSALRYLLTDPSQAKKMGETGRQKVANCFTWLQVANRVIATYQSITR